MKDSQLSKFLALVMRHQPQLIGIELDEQGWAPIDALLGGLHQHGYSAQRSDLERIAAQDSKQRYSLRGEWMRANQGHSVAGVCAVELVPRKPPAQLYHGTTRQRWQRIQSSQPPGLKPGQRHHVHLSDQREIAWEVGARYRSETPMLLQIDAAGLADQGQPFYRSDNGVWMVDFVPLEYLSEC